MSQSVAVGGKGTVKFDSNRGVAKGMRNRRSNKRRLIQEAKLRAERKTQRLLEEREDSYLRDWNEYGD